MALYWKKPRRWGPCAHELGNIYFDGVGVDPELGGSFWKQSIHCFASCSRLAYIEMGRKNTEPVTHTKGGKYGSTVSAKWRKALPHT